VAMPLAVSIRVAINAFMRLIEILSKNRAINPESFLDIPAGMVDKHGSNRG